MVAIANIDEIIKIIKKSKDPKIAAQELVKKKWKAGPVEAILKKVGKDACKPKGVSRGVGLSGKSYKLSNAQAKAILELRLGRLTGLEQDNLSSEFNALIGKITSLQEIIDDKGVLQKVIEDELNEIKETYGDDLSLIHI